MTLVIGIGNPLRGCDRFGIELANLLSDKFDTIITHQLTPELVEKLYNYDEIIFLDTSFGVPNAAIACSISDSIDSISHKTNLFDFIEFAKVFHNKEFEYSLYSILCENFEYSEKLEKTFKNSLKIVEEYILNNAT